MNLFAYGTLMFPEVIRAVTGREFSSLPADLNGYARYRVKQAAFPGIISDPNAITSGRLYRDIDASALSCIDAFEGTIYVRRGVTVISGPDTKMEAEVYVVPEERRNFLTTEPWDPMAFHQKDLFRFLGMPDPEST